MAAPQQTDIVSRGAASSNTSYLEWGPVWAGAVVAIAITTILTQFGATAGLAISDPIRADNTVSYGFIAAGLWLLLVSVSSSAAAGYLAGRMRMTMNDASADEVEFRDGVHGITAWAVSTVIVAMAATLTGILTTAALVVADGPELSLELQNWATNQSVIIGFATAAGAALGAAAAWFAAVAGAKHRDEGTTLNVLVPSMLRKK
ncbi:hypothetical protein [Maritalea sp.]|uniref:hypothetical protein n=1 Tax=Maritalea sp. TaxID=2003361 RepID=UPI003EF8D4EE